jgi:hypothetical protein
MLERAVISTSFFIEANIGISRRYFHASDGLGQRGVGLQMRLTACLRDSRVSMMGFTLPSI